VPRQRSKRFLRGVWCDGRSLLTGFWPPRYGANMSRRVSLLVAAVASALGFALMAWVSSAGSLQMLQAPAPTGGPPAFSGRTAAPLPTQTVPSSNTTPEPLPGPGPDLPWVDAVLTVLALTAALIVFALLARWVWRRGWQMRWRHLDQPSEVPFEVLPEVALALANDAPAQLATLQDGSPRNAIVACWLRLEGVAGTAGVPALPTETSTEFTARVLGALAFDPAMINGFAGLYREARFSRHELGEPTRRAAIAALRSLYADIGADVGTDIGVWDSPKATDLPPGSDMSDQGAS